MNEDKMIIVRNRNAGSTGYGLDNGFHRNFEHNETKKIPLSELVSLSYAPGGEYILKNCLVIEDKSALDYLNLQVEPEYFYSEEDIKKILTDVNQESLDRLEDTLNFAPAGVIEMVKKLAVELEIPDVRKRNLITEKTGFNVNNSIQINHILAEGEDEVAETQTPARKTTPLTPNTSPERKTAVPAQKYKVVSKN